MKKAVKSFKNKDELQKFMDTDLEWMYNRILVAIKDTVDREYETAQILDARIEEDFSEFSLSSPAEDWIDSLNLTLKWFEKKEEYEKCSEVVELIERIKKEYDWLYGGKQEEI